jgi:prepilin-type N-terminal cleavage/methylation domain-containing protein
MKSYLERKRASGRGFTLLEMMVVIMIIGILSTALIVQLPEMIDNSKLTASEANMKNIFLSLQTYQTNHNGNWPRSQGIKFLLTPWKENMIEHTEAKANMFFSPAESFSDIMAYQGFDEDMDVVEYLNDWDSIGPGYISYAGFTAGGDRDVMQQLKRNPGLTTIISDAHFVHRYAMVYLTGDGAPHRMLASDIEEETGIDPLVDDLIPGPGCEVEEFRTVINE